MALKKKKGKKRGGQPHPGPEPEGPKHPAKPRDFDPHEQKDYRERERDAADPHQSGPGT